MRLARPVTAVVFDMDGVLLDTERLYTEATQQIVGRFGKVFDWSIKGHMIGRPARDSARYLVDALELPITPDDYLREREALFETLMPTAEAVPWRARAGGGARRPRRADGRRHQLRQPALRPQDHAPSRLVRALPGGRERRRPAHRARQACARHLPPRRARAGRRARGGVSPSRTRRPASPSARAAGMQVIAVPDPALGRERVADADLVLDSLLGLRPADLGFAGVASSEDSGA